MARASEASPLDVIKDAMPTLTGATLRVAETILADPDQVGRGSITTLAARASTSPATVTRLSKALGFGGYPALRAAIATENGRGVQAGWERDIGSEITPTDTPEQVLNVLASTQSRALRNAMSSIDLQTIADVADRIAVAGRIHIYGEWGDAIPAKELYIRLLRIGRPVWFHEGAQDSRIGASLLGEGDVALVLCRSGEDPIAEQFIEMANSGGAFSTVITGAPESSLSEIAQATLFTGTRQGQFWTDYFAGRTSDALTAGLLWVLVAQRVPDTIAAVYEHLYGPSEPAPVHESQVRPRNRTRKRGP